MRGKKNMKILVIEDEKKVANFIKRGLEEEKYEVDNGERWGKRSALGGRRFLRPRYP